MQLTEEYLKLKRAEFERELNGHMQAVRRFEGAVIAINIMLEDLKKPELKTDQDVAAVVGADSAEFVPVGDTDGQTKKDS